MIMEHNVKLVMKVCEDKVGTREQCSKYIDGKDKLEKRDSLELAASQNTETTVATESKQTKCNFSHILAYCLYIV